MGKKKCTSVVATTFVELLVKISHFELLLKMALNMVSITWPRLNNIANKNNNNNNNPCEMNSHILVSFC
jgi:hypothetical protein